MAMRTVRIILRTEVHESDADAVIARFEAAARPLLEYVPSDRTTRLTARTIEWHGTGTGTQVATRKVLP